MSRFLMSTVQLSNHIRRKHHFSISQSYLSIVQIVRQPVFLSQTIQQAQHGRDDQITETIGIY